MGFLPTASFFIWHPSGKDYHRQICGYAFAAGRIPGAVNGVTAQLMQAHGCRVEPYEPGMDIVDWNPQATGGFDPVFGFDPVYKAAEKAPEPEATLVAMAEVFPEVLAVAEKLSEPISTPEQAEEAMEIMLEQSKPEPEPEPEPAKKPRPPKDYSRMNKSALKAECEKRGLAAAKKSIPKMLAALEADDRAGD